MARREKIKSATKKVVRSVADGASKAFWTTVMLRKKHPNPERIVVVESSAPTPPRDGIELSPFDVWESRFPVTLVSVYPPGRAPSVESLVEGLKELLAIYPSLGGRIRREGEGRDRAVVRFDKFERGEDVRGRCKLIVGRVEEKASYSDGIGKDGEWDRGLFEEKWIASVAVGLPVVTGKALFEARFTPLADGGVVLSACASHGLCDMQSFGQVLTDWARLCRGERARENVASSMMYDGGRQDLLLSASTRARKHDPGSGEKLPGFVERMYWASVADMVFPALAKTDVRSFNFTRADVDALKTVVKSGRAWPTFLERGHRLSAHDVITALLWQSLAKVHPYHPKQDWGLVVVVNWRGKSHRIPIDYFGNATTQPKTSRTMRQITEMDLSECALVVRELGNVSAEEVEQLIVRKNQIQHGDGGEGQEGESDIDRLINVSGNTPDGGCGLYISNFSKFDVYDTDFGNGRPEIVRFPHPPIPGFCYVYPSAEGNSDLKVVVTVFEKDSRRLVGLDCIKGQPILVGEEIPQAETFKSSMTENIDQQQFKQAVDLLCFGEAGGGEVE